jgi:hypothetical protein
VTDEVERFDELAKRFLRSKNGASVENRIDDNVNGARTSRPRELILSWKSRTPDRNILARESLRWFWSDRLN